MADNTNQIGDNVSKTMHDLSREGEKSAELMLECIYADLKEKAKTPQELEKGVNDTIKSVNNEANKEKGYNLNFEIVDDNKDGKWNQGEKIQVHNSSRYFFRQPAAFSLDGNPDAKNGPDGMLKNRTQLDAELAK